MIMMTVMVLVNITDYNHACVTNAIIITATHVLAVKEMTFSVFVINVKGTTVRIVPVLVHVYHAQGLIVMVAVILNVANAIETYARDVLIKAMNATIAA